jgi:TetR/AcrR family transcriptional regulator, cholesterol catabolism regulator
MSINRDQILESAAQVFCQKGYHGASMADIAQAVGLQKATLYHHFKSKQEILSELLDHALFLVTDNMTRVVQMDRPPEEKLHLAMRTYLQTLCDQLNLSSVLIMEYRSLDKDLYNRHIRNRDRFENMWRDLIQEGVNNGKFKCESIPMTVRALLGVMNWTINWYRPDGKLSAESIADQFADLFMVGIRPKPQSIRKKT